MTTDQKTIEYLLKRIEALEKENKMWENKFHEQNMKEITVNVKEFPKQFGRDYLGLKNKDSEFVVPEKPKNQLIIDSLKEGVGFICPNCRKEQTLGLDVDLLK